LKEKENINLLKRHVTFMHIHSCMT